MTSEVIIVVIALIATAFAVHAGRATDEAGSARRSQRSGRCHPQHDRSEIRPRVRARADAPQVKGMKIMGSAREEGRMGRYGRVWEKFIVAFALPIAIVAVAFALFDRPAR